LSIAQHSLEWVSSLLDSIPAEIAVLDSTGSIVYVNHEWRGFGTRNDAPANCFEGANYLDTCRRSSEAGDEDADQVAKALSHILDGTLQRYTCEYPCATPEGMNWFRMILSSTFQQGERFVIVQHIDITERIEAEQRYRHILASVAETVIVTDSSAKILSVNPAAENLFAATSAALIGTDLAHLIPIPAPQAGLHLQCEHESAIQGKQSLSVSCFPIESREGTQFVWTITDVSALERERSSREREQRSLATFEIGSINAALWNSLQESYRLLITSGTAATSFNQAQQISFRIEAFVESLHQNNINPQDFVRLHANVLNALQTESRIERSRALAEEGRLLLLRILADLGSLYHNAQRVQP
jgi:PAS domain S-box-containing protein